MKQKKLTEFKKINKKGVFGWIQLALLFLILALISGVLGFGLISGLSFVIAKWLAIIFVVLFIITIIAHTVKSA